MAALATMSVAGAAATLLGERFYELEALGMRRLALIAVNYFLLQAAWFGVTLSVSVFGREAGRVSIAGFLVILLSYLTQVIAEIWPRAAFLLRYSPNAYYDPRVIVKSGGLPLRSVIVLAGLAAVCSTISIWHFRRRDIP
jgi:ABC-type transport system involved in multi-copper enzyme maturation permease subunit